MSYYIGLSILSNSGKKSLSAEARRILSQFEGFPAAEAMVREEHGRPFFPDFDADFSISHSGSLAAVSLVRGKGLRTGCDVEFVRQRKMSNKIAEEFFSAGERDYVAFDKTRFFQIWTLKECYIKLNGLSVFDMAEVPSFIHGGEFAFCAAAASPLAFYLYELAGAADERYIMAAAVEGIEAEPELRWFSQDSLFCKSIAKINAPLSPAETVRPKM